MLSSHYWEIAHHYSVSSRHHVFPSNGRRPTPWPPALRETVVLFEDDESIRASAIIPTVVVPWFWALPLGATSRTPLLAYPRMVRIYPRRRLLARRQSGQGFHLPLELEIDFTQGALGIGLVLDKYRRLTRTLNTLAAVRPVAQRGSGCCSVRRALTAVRYASVMSSTVSDNRRCWPLAHYKMLVNFTPRNNP